MSARRLREPLGRRPFEAIRLLERQALRGVSVKDRARTRRAILAGLEAFMHESHMRGRIYSKGGEKAKPSVEWMQTKDAAIRAFATAFRDEYNRGAGR